VSRKVGPAGGDAAPGAITDFISVA
jgi:hypothetical protein